MSDNIIKKIIIGISIPILFLIISWSVWTTKNVFSAQRTEIILQEYRVDNEKKQNNIREELKTLKNSVDDSFNKLNNKIDTNTRNQLQFTQENNKILLDLQKQIGDLKK